VEPPKPVDDIERNVIRDVADPGWHVAHVPPEGETPGWSFTIGLQHTFGHPEIVVFGVPHEVAHDLLNLAGEAIASGRAYEVGPVYLDFLEDYGCVFRDVRAAWFGPFLGLAVWFYRGLDFPVRQLFWPSRDHAYPWDAHASDSLKATQPLLYEADPAAANAEALLATLED